MNAAHWLWAGHGFLAYHETIPSRLHLEFETRDQFASGALRIVSEAASVARDLEERFSSHDSAAKFLIERARSSPDRMMPSWWGYQAGVAAGLCGDFPAARSFLSGITDSRVTDHANRLLPLLDSERFICEINQIVAEQRRALHLPILERDVFAT